MCAKKEPGSRFALAVEATEKMLWQRLAAFQQESSVHALMTHTETQALPIGQRNSRFYGRFLPLLMALTAALSEAYRRYFKLALANPQEDCTDPHEWACNQLQEGIGVAFQWISDWWVLACDGENRNVRKVASTPVVQGETVSVSVSIPATVPTNFQDNAWCAPCWTFVVSPATGISLLKTRHVPDTNSDERLSRGHSRLILKAMRRVLLARLVTEIDEARNEETVTAGSVAAHIEHDHTNSSNKRGSKSAPKGFDGLSQKLMDLSQYKAGLTDKQWMAFSLKHEYGLGPAQISSRMEVHRKTVDEHLVAAEKRINQLYSNERRKAQSAKDPSD